MTDANQSDALRQTWGVQPDHLAEIERLRDLLCLADELLMDVFGAFPLPGHSLRDSCLLVRQETGDDYHERKRRAARARLARKAG